MKKLLYLLLLLPLGFLASCDDDDDFPAVDITVHLNNAAMVDNQIYVVQSDDGFDIEGLSVKSLNDRGAALAHILYYIDGGLVGSPIFEPPYDGEINTKGLPAGTHYIDFTFDILQVDKSLAWGRIQVPFIVVEKVEDLPEGAVLGEVSVTETIDPKKK